ncbi:MAG: hypothetical protein Q9190_002945 [Brigantiaea leucoxantha]
MGISGLLPLLKSIQKPSNLKKFAGNTVGVDAYGWLHRGAVACAVDLALEKPTTKFVDFSMHRVRMLIHFGVIPYIVFDGDFLPSKAATEVERSRKREESKRVGLELYRLGKPSQAHLELQKAVDVTPEMAGQLIEELKTAGVQYVVAPYEADAQLAYLEKKGIIQGILSEDSDLLVFGAKTLLTKLDQYGDCIEINRNDFTACRDISLVGWTDAEFRRMAILSGCDYLASINKMGLKTAYRLVRKYRTIEKIVRMLSFDGQYHVPAGYFEAFKRAELTFLHQRVFCPLANDVVMMQELNEDDKSQDLSFIGGEVEQEIAIRVAKGDFHPTTKKPLVVRMRTIDTQLLRSPWTNTKRPTAVTPSDPKANKSIDTFFKAKRTPLAELDPNSFTPSPSQQRLLQRTSGTWTSSPASSRHYVSHTGASTPAPHTTPVRSTDTIGEQKSRINSPKRRRLCSDSVEEGLLSEIPQAESERSRFFSSPSLKHRLPKTIKTKKGRQEISKINIWSDDSVEDAMAHLPDISDGQSQAPQNTIKVFTEQPEKITTDTPNMSQDVNETQKNSQSSITSATTSQLISPAETAATSIADSAEVEDTARTLDQHVQADLADLRKDYLYQPETAAPRKAQRPMLETITNRTTSKPLLARQGSMTPLQRLGIGALNRSHSFSSALNRKTMSMTTTTTTTSIRTPTLTPNQQATGAANTSVLSSFSTLPRKKIASVQKGSEDAIIPDSEAESEGLSEVEESAKPVMDLGRFAFVG